MASVTVTGSLICSDGTMIPLRNDSQAEGTEFSLTTDTNFTTVAQNAGDYVPGKTVQRGIVNAPNGIAYAYVLRQGLIAALIPVSVSGVQNSAPVPMPRALTLQAGDIVRVLHLTNSARNCSASIVTNTGNQRIFQATPSGAATNSMTDLQTSNSLGDTLQGETIVGGWVTSVDGAKIVTPGGGIVVIDAAGNAVGSLGASNPAAVQADVSQVSIPVALNWSMAIITNA